MIPTRIASLRHSSFLASACGSCVAGAELSQAERHASKGRASMHSGPAEGQPICDSSSVERLCDLLCDRIEGALHQSWDSEVRSAAKRFDGQMLQRNRMKRSSISQQNEHELNH